MHFPGQNAVSIVVASSVAALEEERRKSDFRLVQSDVLCCHACLKLPFGARDCHTFVWPLFFGPSLHIEYSQNGSSIESLQWLSFVATVNTH